MGETRPAVRPKALRASFPEGVVRGPEVLDPKASAELPCRNPFHKHQLGLPKPSIGEEATRITLPERLQAVLHRPFETRKLWPWLQRNVGQVSLVTGRLVERFPAASIDEQNLRKPLIA